MATTIRLYQRLDSTQSYRLIPVKFSRNGQPIADPHATAFYLRYRANGKHLRTPAGSDVLEANQMLEELRIRVAERRAILEVMIGNLVPRSLDMGNQVWVAQNSVGNKKECGLRIMTLKECENLRREDWMRAIVEGKRNEWSVGSDSVHNVGGEPLQDKG